MYTFFSGLYNPFTLIWTLKPAAPFCASGIRSVFILPFCDANRIIIVSKRKSKPLIKLYSFYTVINFIFRVRRAPRQEMAKSLSQVYALNNIFFIIVFCKKDDEFTKAFHTY